jgi:hypothetical protein
MKKDKTILDFVDRLKVNPTLTGLTLVDNWPSDLCAIGIQKGDKLVYISTFNFIDESDIKYDYDLEHIDKSDNSNIIVVKEGRGVTEQHLITELKSFLGVSS